MSCATPATPLGGAGDQTTRLCSTPWVGKACGKFLPPGEGRKGSRNGPRARAGIQTPFSFPTARVFSSRSMKGLFYTGLALLDWGTKEHKILLHGVSVRRLRSYWTSSLREGGRTLRRAV